MSIPNLPINFKDDILAATNQKRKYNLIQNDDGTVSFEDATEYQQTGSDFGAGQINATNDAINKIYSERILSLEETALVTEPGFFVDALVVSELIGEIYNEKILWSHSGMFLNDGQSINLLEKLSDQKRGIVLVLSRYESGASQDYGYCTYFVPKECLDFGVNKPGFEIPLVKYSDGSIVVGSKYIYVSDDKIEGVATNGTSPNSGWVFRYAISM